MRKLSWIAAAAAIACGGSASSSPVDPPPVSGAPMTAANRTEGVAPLAVFFDAVDTVPSGTASPFTWASGVYQPSDGDYEAVNYVWDFGDATAGVWSTTGLTRNRATGYTTAHVYETPGTYTASLTVTAKRGTVYTYQQTVTVRAFSGTTYYVAADGSDANNGTSAATPFATVARGITAVNGGSNRRLLLRRGDVFTTAGVVLTAAGPGIVGAYGTGNRPVLDVTGTSDGIAIRGSDWRVMDLEVAYPTATSGDPNGVSGVIGTKLANALILRVKTTNFRVGMLVGQAAVDGDPNDGNAFVDCEVATPYVNGMYVGGRRIAVMGCDVHDPVTSHVLRMWQGHKAVVSNNRLWNPGPTRHAFKFPGPYYNDGRPETRWATVSDNLVRGKTWSVAIGPEDSGSDQRVSHVVYERNRHYPESSVQIDLLIEGCRDVLARNNVFDGSGVGASYRAVRIARRGIEPVPDRVRVLANTAVRNDGVANDFIGVEVMSGATNVTVRDNLFAVSSSATPRVAIDSTAAGAGFAASHNLLETPSGTLFTDLAGSDFSLQAISPAVDAGVDLPEVRTDFSGFSRPRGLRADIGALESH